MLTFNPEKMIQQEFPFKSPIMDYIFKNISAQQLLKLYKTCKFFYNKIRLNIIEDFNITSTKSDQRIVGNSMAVWYQNPAMMELKNLWISRSFVYCLFPEEVGNLKFEIFSRLTYTSLQMTGEFSIDEYEFLVKPSTLRNLIVAGKIYGHDPEMNLSFYECIERLPHVSAIEISLFDGSSRPLSSLDMTKLCALERQTKLTSLHLDQILKVPDPLLVIEYLMKFATPDVDYHFQFDIGDPEYDVINIKNFYNIIDAGLREWKISFEMPPTISSSLIDLTGKIALITGAAEGIGKATTILFRQLGATVFAFARNRIQLKCLIDECTNPKNAGVLHTADIDIEHNDWLNNFHFKFCTKIDILVNIADTLECDIIPGSKLKRDKQYVLQGNYNVIQKTRQLLIQSKGSIINVQVPLITKSENAASIANLDRKIKNAELQLSSSGVRINTVSSGTSPTALPCPVGMHAFDYKKYLQETKKTHDEHIANAIAFLACDSAKLINGAILPIDALNL